MAEARPTRHAVVPTRVVAVRGPRHGERPDDLVGEEPMEIRAAGPGEEPVSVAVTMRTPGHDFELAVGLLTTEGLLTSPDQLAAVRYCDLPDVAEQQYNIVTVWLRHHFDAAAVTRNLVATSSCGICGKATLDQVVRQCPTVGQGPLVGRTTLAALPRTLREGQRVFARTGGLHAAGLFDRRGDMLLLREDVGRHNALDKLVGRGLMDGALPLSDRVLVVSGRVSFEIVQKAAMAGIPFIGAVSAPSSLAVDGARRLGITLIGFIRADGFNVYSHPERVDLDA